MNPDNKRPSSEYDTYWIVAQNKTEHNNRGPVNSGKWMVFEHVSKIDETWDTIKTATESGKLGFASKVSTMKDKEGRSVQPSSQFVICIYTYDWKDEADVMRVREELRNLGFEKKLPYKSDDDTAAGLYAHTTTKRISKYYC